MKSNETQAAAVFAVVMGGAVVLAIANDVTAPICRAAAEAVPRDKFDFGCFEFWFNRYQGFDGGMLALAGATITVGVMRWQTMAESRRRRKIAIMRALAELRPFRFESEALFGSTRFLEPDDDVIGELPQLRFPREPELLADLSEDDASNLMHYALIVDRIRSKQELVDVIGFTNRDFLWAFSARFADEAFDLVNDLALQLDWATDTDRPSDDPDIREAMKFAEEMRAELF